MKVMHAIWVSMKRNFGGIVFRCALLAATWILIGKKILELFGPCTTPTASMYKWVTIRCCLLAATTNLLCRKILFTWIYYCFYPKYSMEFCCQCALLRKPVLGLITRSCVTSRGNEIMISQMLRLKGREQHNKGNSYRYCSNLLCCCCSNSIGIMFCWYCVGYYIIWFLLLASSVVIIVTSSK